MDHTQEIDRYLHGGMSDGERADFERRLATDEALAAELTQQQKITNALRDGEARAFHQRLQQIRQKGSAANLQPHRNSRVPIIGATVVVLVAIATIAALYWFNTAPKRGELPTPAQQAPQQQPNVVRPVDVPKAVDEKETVPVASANKKYMALALRYYSSPDDLTRIWVRRPSDTARITLMQKAKIAYDEAAGLVKSDARQAHKLFASVILMLANPPDSISSMARYLRGHAHFQLKNYAAAAADFQYVASHEGKDALNAQWYGALCWLAIDGPTTKVVAQLRMLARESGAHRSEAAELLLKIQSQ